LNDFREDRQALEIGELRHVKFHKYGRKMVLYRCPDRVEVIAPTRIAFMIDDAQTPRGEFKNSGIGREYGRHEIEASIETRAILESHEELS
jgi:hypothetical protein